MMRRRKRKVSGRKEPLQFVESPVNITHKIPSPIFASDNPCTADVVPVDGNITAGWVSPQFLEPPAPGRVTRARRRQQKSTSTDSDTTKSPHKKTKKPNKLVPLKFNDDISYETLSIEHSCEVTGNSDIAGKKPCRSKKSSGDTASSDVEVIDTEEYETPVLSKANKKPSKSKKTTQLLDDIHGIESTGAFKRLQQQEELNDCEELPDCFTNIKSIKKGRNVKKLCLDTMDSEITLLGSQDTAAKDTHSTDSSPVFQTQRIPVNSSKKKRKKRLFSAPSCSPDNSPGDENTGVKNQSMEEVSNVSAEFCPLNIDTPDIGTHHQLPLSARQMNGPRTDSSLRRRSGRLKELLVGNTPNRTLNASKILAYDTPESEYGLTARQRQLRHWKEKHH